MCTLPSHISRERRVESCCTSCLLMGIETLIEKFKFLHGFPLAVLLDRPAQTAALRPRQDQPPEVSNHRVPACLLCGWELRGRQGESQVRKYDKFEALRFSLRDKNSVSHQHLSALQEICSHHPQALHSALQSLHPEHRSAGQHPAAQEPGWQHQQYVSEIQSWLYFKPSRLYNLLILTSIGFNHYLKPLSPTSFGLWSLKISTRDPSSSVPYVYELWAVSFEILRVRHSHNMFYLQESNKLRRTTETVNKPVWGCMTL